MTHPLRPQRTRQDFEVGDKALVCDERGRIVGRVVIASDRLRDNEIGYFYQCREEWPGRGDVDCRAGELLACDDAWRPLAEQPPELAAPDHRRVASADYGQGRVYAPEPYKRHVVGQHPVMEKFDRVRPVPIDNVELEHASLSGDQAARLAEAQRLGATTGAAAPFARRQAREITVALHAELAAQQERQAIDRGQVETIATALARKEDVDVSDGKVRIRSRDGLESMLTAGAINRIQFTAGMKYRDAFEDARAEMRAQTYEGMPGGSKGDPFAWQMLHCAAQQKVHAIEAEVVRTQRNPRGLTALRLTAGEGRPIAHYGGSGGSRRLYVAALILALDTLADHWGLQ